MSSRITDAKQSLLNFYGTRWKNRAAYVAKYVEKLDYKNSNIRALTMTAMLKNSQNCDNILKMYENINYKYYVDEECLFLDFTNGTIILYTLENGFEFDICDETTNPNEAIFHALVLLAYESPIPEEILIPAMSAFKELDVI